MAVNLAGTYFISCALGAGLIAGPAVLNGITPVFGGDATAPDFDQWNVVAAGNPGSNLYTVSRGVDNNEFIFFLKESGLLFIANSTSIANATVWSIELTGNNEFRFHDPSEDLVWTVDTFGDEVRVSSDSDLPGQRWFLIDALD